MKAVVYDGIKDVKVKPAGDPEIINQDDLIVKVTSTAIGKASISKITKTPVNTLKKSPAAERIQ